MPQVEAGKVLFAVVATLGLFFAGLLVGHHYGGATAQNKCLKAENTQQAAVIVHDAKVATAAAAQASDAQAIGVHVQQQTEKIHETIRQVIVKVPVFIPAAADARCVVNAGLVRVWNDANRVSGELPASAAGGQQPSAEASGAGGLGAAQPFRLPAE